MRRASFPSYSLTRFRGPPARHDARAHASGPFDDAVVLPGIGGIAEDHHQRFIARIHRTVDPERRYVADGLRLDAYGAGLASGRFHQHDAAARLPVIDLRA